MICSCPNRATLLVWATAIPTGMGSAAMRKGRRDDHGGDHGEKGQYAREHPLHFTPPTPVSHAKSSVNGAARGAAGLGPGAVGERGSRAGACLVYHSRARCFNGVPPARASAWGPVSRCPAAKLDSRRHGRAKYVRMSARVTPPTFRAVTRRDILRGAVGAPATLGAPARRPGRGAGSSHRPVGALRSRLRRVVRPEVCPRVGAAERRHRRDRPSRAERAPRARRHRGRDAAGARHLRVSRVAGRVRAARGAHDRRRDRVRGPVRTPPGLRPEGHLQPQDRSSTSPFRRAGPPRRSTTGRDLWGEAGVKPDTWELVREGARKIREKRGVPAGFGLSPETDSNMTLRGLLWAFGAAEQDEAGQVAINSPGDGRGGQADGHHLPRVHDPGRVHVGRGLEQPRLRVGPGLHHPEPDLGHPEHGEEQPRARQAGACSRPRPRGPPRAWRPRTCFTATWSGSSPTRSSWPSASWSTSWRPPTRGSARASSTISRASPGRCTTSRESSASPRAAALPGKGAPAPPADRYALLAEADRWSALPGHPGHVTPAIDETLQRGVIPCDVRARRARRADARGVRARRGGRDAPHLRSLEQVERGERGAPMNVGAGARP